jgi:hypothetical protein
MGRPLLNDSILVIIIPIHEAFLHMCYELGFPMKPYSMCLVIAPSLRFEKHE